MTTQAEWELHLVGTDETPGLLDRYFMGTTDSGVIIWFCRRCPGGHVQIIARDFDGDQTNLTVGELAQTALEHERERHAGPASDQTCVICGKPSKDAECTECFVREDAAAARRADV